MNTTNHTSPSGEDATCSTCNGHGMIGGPSYYSPDEGGEPCPDCNVPQIGEDAANGAMLPAWFDMFLTNVCEIPDRNSPEDEPEAMIATAEELRNCAINAIEHFECQRSALTDPLQGWSVYVERNGEHFLTISNNHVAGAEITDDLAALVRTAAAHLLSFAGNGQDHAGGYVGLSAEKTLSANGAIGERDDTAKLLKLAEHLESGSSSIFSYEAGEDYAQTLRRFIAARAALTAEKVACPHRIADARNPIIKSGYVCVDCGALFGAAALTAALEKGDELSLQAQYEDACIVANMNARDAERYRWLRDFNVRCKDGVNINPPCEHVHASMYSHAVGTIPAVRLVTGEELDRAIDAALSQKAGEQQ